MTPAQETAMREIVRQIDTHWPDSSCRRRSVTNVVQILRWLARQRPDRTSPTTLKGAA